MNVKDKVLSLLQSKEWICVEDFERIFPPKTEGHMSWGQRKRQLTSEGYNIIKRKKEGCPHTWEYSLILPERQLAPIFTERAGQLSFIG